MSCCTMHHVMKYYEYIWISLSVSHEVLNIYMNVNTYLPVLIGIYVLCRFAQYSSFCRSGIWILLKHQPLKLWYCSWSHTAFSEGRLIDRLLFLHGTVVIPEPLVVLN
jgi:hypothetical protein